MLTEDDNPGGKPAKPKNLDAMSVDELKEYVAGLQGEIARVETEIAKKQASKAAADAFFKA
jgi:uncharacterized small protein (DUF1192 family)